jgi:hypothetical protein
MHTVNAIYYVTTRPLLCQAFTGLFIISFLLSLFSPFLFSYFGSKPRGIISGLFHLPMRHFFWRTEKQAVLYDVLNDHNKKDALYIEK